MTTPAVTFHPADFISEELVKREWTTDRLIAEANGDERDLLALNFYLCIQKPGVFLGHLADVLAAGFGTSADLWRNLDEAWRRTPERSEKIEMPDEIFGPASQLMFSQIEVASAALDEAVSPSAVQEKNTDG